MTQNKLRPFSESVNDNCRVDDHSDNSIKKIPDSTSGESMPMKRPTDQSQSKKGSLQKDSKHVDEIHKMLENSNQFQQLFEAQDGAFSFNKKRPEQNDSEYLNPKS